MATSIRTYLLLPLFCLMAVGLTPSITYGADCHLQGTWDTGFLTSRGPGVARIALTFDCVGNATMDTTLLRGSMFTGAGEVYRRTGRYTLVGPSTDVIGGIGVDVIIDTLDVTYLDYNTLKLDTDSEHCATPDALILEPQNILGRSCYGITFPRAGFIERAVALVEGEKLYWSPYVGPNQVVIQPPEEPARRPSTVNRKTPFFPVTPHF